MSKPKKLDNGYIFDGLIFMCDKSNLKLYMKYNEDSSGLGFWNYALVRFK